MTFYEFAMAINGWARANGASGDKPERTYPTEQEFEDAIMRLH